MWFSKAKPKPDPEDPFFAWSQEACSVGVNLFDQEHEQLAALMGQIHATLLENHDRDQAQRLMESLIHATGAHFDHEERVMEEVGYAGREAHAAAHETLIREAKDLLHKYKTGAISSMALPGFIKTWLLPHIQMDRKYSACLRRNGIS